MKLFFFMDHNPENKSGVSWKLWKIERRGRAVSVWWGAAVLSRRRPVPAGSLRTKTWRFRSEALAEKFEQQRIANKIRSGYKRMTRRRR
jgi:hypothetical protein